MKKHNVWPVAIASLALLLGLLLPMLTAAGQDASLDRQSWALSDSNAHYAYQGTLMNRVIALNAHLNGSPAVERSEGENIDAPAGMLNRLASSLSVEGDFTEESSIFTLSPKQYSAEYRYQSVSYSSENTDIALIIDSETGLLVRLELKCPPEQLNDWLEVRDLWDILHEYGAYLNLGEPTDDETGISAVIRSQSAQLRGTAYKATVTVIPSAGTLLLKLAASTPA